jgi:hypothetical protein
LLNGRQPQKSIRRSGAAGFTVGTSALDGKFPADGPGLKAQLRVISACMMGLAQ